MASWITTGTAAAYAPSPAGGLGGFPATTSLDGTEAIWIGQAGGTKATTLAALRAFVTA